MSHLIRQPAVAGSFYPDNPKQLSEMITVYLDAAASFSYKPKAMIVPHAGYIYSGPIAASAYACLHNCSHINRVVLLGPSHRVGFHGLALSHADYYATPLGNIPVDILMRDKVLQLPGVDYLDRAHLQEHCLEVQLPFLQHQLGIFSILPIVAGEASAEQVCDVLTALWGGEETLIVISSDLSHYHAYAEAQCMDRQTSQDIEALAYEKLNVDSACGRVPISGLLAYARKYGLQLKNIDLRNSGDTAGDKNRVVGYGAYVIE